MTTPLSKILVGLLCAVFFNGAYGTTTLLTFSDDNCGDFVESLVGKDSFPSGGCTKFANQISAPYKSFMLNTLSLGCGVTIYGNDTTPDSCSSDLKIVAFQGKCYNSTWAYYSVDLCTPLVPSPSTTSDESPLQTGAANPTEAGASLVNNSLSLGAVAGISVVSTLLFVGATATAIYFLWCQPRMKKQQEQQYNNGYNHGFIEEQKVRTAIPQQYPAEAPWQAQRPWELTPSPIVEAPYETHPRHEIGGA
ncbi:hypothetical protein F4808DRAFT_211903 [Astrocystis sublimbata]|nr:hypothetical protein F4808DRAFT_211903 [Astrocystis sublimbata]